MHTVVPFTLTASGPLLMVPTRVNGQGPYAFLLDTGAAETLVSVDLAHQLGLVSEVLLEATSASGNLPIFPSCLASLTVGIAKADGVTVWIADLTQLRQVTEAPIAGQLGANFLAHFRVTIDYPRALVHFAQGAAPEASDSNAEWTRVPFRHMDRERPLVLLPTMVNGWGPYTFLLDTGASVLVLAPAVAYALGLRQHAAESVVGAAGRTLGWMSSLETIAVGQAECCRLPALIADIFAALSNDVGTRVEGVLGYPFLQAFQLTLDYQEEAVLLRTLTQAI
jgi:predicted aspartyl protease